MTVKCRNEKMTQYLSGTTGDRSRRCRIIIASIALILFVVILILALVFFVSDVGQYAEQDGTRLNYESWKKSEGCSPPCGQRGTCYNADGVDFCFCDPGYKGIQCVEEKTSCLDDPCIHGSCRCRKGGFICVCTGNFTGQFCEAKKRTCAGAGPCQRSKTPPKPEAGWVHPFNGYAYLVTHKEHTWQGAKDVCESHQANLASVGIRNEGIRKFLARTYLADDELIWIGLSNTTGDSKWLWNDGRELLTKTRYWYEETPEEKKNFTHNCALLDTRTPSKSYLSRRYLCESRFKGLCEKKIYV